MIETDYNIIPGRTSEQWESEALAEYAHLSAKAQTLIRQLMADHQAATTLLEKNGVSCRLRPDDSARLMIEAMEVEIGLASLSDYINDRRAAIRAGSKKEGRAAI